MISVIISTDNSRATLSATLESLIPAAVAGLVREVIVADGGSSDTTVPIADGFGATVITAGPARANRLIAGAQLAKCPGLLFLDPDCVLQDGWERDIDKLLITLDQSARPAQAITFRYRLDERTWAARTAEIAASLTSAILGIAHSGQGLLIPRTLYAAAGGFRPLERLEFADLARRFGRQRFLRLPITASHQAPDPRSEGHTKTLLRYYGHVVLFMLNIPIGQRSSHPGPLLSGPPSS